MYLPILENGNELEIYLTSEFGDSILDYGWKIKRKEERNRSVKIKGYLVAGTLDNAVVGVALNSDVNIIIILDCNIPVSLLDELLEIIYKNDLFIFELGIDWLYNSVIGNNFITKIFNGVEFSIWKEKIFEDHCMINFSKYSSLNATLERFPNSIKWIHPKQIDTLGALKLDNLLLIEHINNFELILKLKPTIIVTHTINSHIVNFCWKNQIILVWIHISSLLNEVIRELVYYLNLGKSMKNINVYYNKDIKHL